MKQDELAVHERSASYNRLGSSRSCMCNQTSPLQDEGVATTTIVGAVVEGGATRDAATTITW